MSQEYILNELRKKGVLFIVMAAAIYGLYILYSQERKEVRKEREEARKEHIVLRDRVEKLEAKVDVCMNERLLIYEKVNTQNMDVIRANTSALERLEKRMR